MKRASEDWMKKIANHKGGRMKRSGLILRQRRGISLEALRKTTETLRLIGALVEIRSEHFPNMSQKSHRLSQPARLK
jgi:hypothetical protein